MVAKINRGVSLYGAIVYNQQKVDDATARIIYENRMITDVTGNPEQVKQKTAYDMGVRELPACQQEHGEARTAHLVKPLIG